MTLEVSKIKKRKKKARLIFGILFLILLIVIGTVAYVLHSKDRFIASKMDRVVAHLEEKTGLLVKFEDFSTNMTSRANFRKLRVYDKEKKEANPLAVIDDLGVDFEFSPSSEIPLRLKSAALVGADLTMEIDREGHWSLPEPIKKLLGSALSEEGERTGENRGRLKAVVDKALSSLLGFEVSLKDGRVSVIDHRYAKRPPGRFIASNVSGNLFIDFLGRKINADANGDLGNDGGRFGVRVLASEERQWMEVTAKDLKLDFLDPYLPDLMKVGPESRADGRVGFTRENGSAMIPVKFDGDLRNVVIEDKRLSSVPIRDIRLRAKGGLDVDVKKRRFVIEKTQLFMGEAALHVDGTVDLSEQKKPVVEVTMETKSLPIQSALDSIPKDFIPALQGAKVKGEMDFRFHLLVDMNNPNATQVEPALELRGFHVVTPPPAANVWKMREPFEHHAKKNGVEVKTFLVGPGNPEFVPYKDLGKILIGAVLTCEDGRFFSHHGIVLHHVRDSIKANISKERFVRGASTVSMQTVKNLFLTPEKTASRKFQEMLLTWWMEEDIPKERILEIYMNIIEWGPMIYGVGPAAKHYFGKTPTALSPLQAAFLGSIISNPVYYHRFYERGGVGGWSTMLAFVLQKMAERGTITPEEVEWCDPFEPVFSKTGNPAPGGCQKPEEGEEKKSETRPSVSDEKLREMLDQQDVDGEL